MKLRRRDLLAALSRGLHDGTIIMAGRAIETNDRMHRAGPLMLFVTSRAGAIRDHVRLVRRMLLMALQTRLVDPLE